MNTRKIARYIRQQERQLMGEFGSQLGPPVNIANTEGHEYADQLERLVFPDRDENLAKFDCPECGCTVHSPYSGHTWTCQEDYGGCGAEFVPVDVFKRVDDEGSEA